MKTKGLTVGLPLFIVAILTLALWGNIETGTPPQVAVNLPCPDLAAGCSARIGEHAVSVGMDGSFKPLQPFQLWVKAPGARAVKASFTMPGMNMGFNRYTLRPGSAGVFRAQIILPTCVSGRHDWQVTLDIDDAARLSLPLVAGL